jgi:O-antigen/teichoic acid export membrane protein
MRRLLQLGLPMMGSRAVGMLEAWAPVWISGLMVSSTAAAAVGAALRVIAGILSVTGVVSFVSRPIVATLIARGERRLLLAYCRFIATLLGSSMVLMSALAWIEGDLIMRLFFGPQYAAAGLLLAIFSAGYCAQWLVGNIDLALMMGGQHRQLFLVNAAGTAVLVAALAAGTAAAGVHGGAAMFTAYSFAKFLLLAALARKAYGFWSLPTASWPHLARGLELLVHPRPAASPGR